MANKALINYYAKLIARGDYKIEDVPEDTREDVQKRIDELVASAKETETRD